jgi:hypothetical protein
MAKDTIIEYPEVGGKIIDRLRVYYDELNSVAVEIVFDDGPKLFLRFNLLFQHEGNLYSQGTEFPEDSLEDFLVRRYGPTVLRYHLGVSSSGGPTGTDVL